MTRRPSDLGFPIQRPILISGGPRCPDFTSRKMSEGDVRAVPRVTPRLYREAACQYHPRTKSGPISYRLPFPVSCLPCRTNVTPTSYPRHAKSAPRQSPTRYRSDLSATSTVPVDHSQAATSPDDVMLTSSNPLDDVMLTSSKFSRQSQKVHIFTKIRVFSHFYQKNYSALCMHFTTISPPTCRIRFEDHGRPEFACVCYHCQKFTRYLPKFPLRAWFFL